MAFEALSLASMSSLHLSGVIGGRSKVFDSGAAGIAEALIGVVLAAAAVAMWRAPYRALGLARAATGFAILGFLVGLTFTARGGGAVDIAYHATMLPILMATLALLLRGGAGKDARPQPAPSPTLL